MEILANYEKITDWKRLKSTWIVPTMMTNLP